MQWWHKAEICRPAPTNPGRTWEGSVYYLLAEAMNHQNPVITRTTIRMPQ